MGGAVGLVIGQAMVLVIRLVPKSPLADASIPTWAIILSVGFSAATGLIFGLYPAFQAAKKDPIVALRHD